MANDKQIKTWLDDEDEVQQRFAQWTQVPMANHPAIKELFKDYDFNQPYPGLVDRGPAVGRELW